jgi:hypothetical protein
MKKLLFLILLIFLFSCEKDEPQPIKEKCWTCTEIAKNQTSGVSNVIKSWKVCDILEASYQDGRRWMTYVWNGNVSIATLHTVKCIK